MEKKERETSKKTLMIFFDPHHPSLNVLDGCFRGVKVGMVTLGDCRQGDIVSSAAERIVSIVQ